MTRRLPKKPTMQTMAKTTGTIHETRPWKKYSEQASLCLEIKSEKCHFFENL
jgi:hypothetical protein